MTWIIMDWIISKNFQIKAACNVLSRKTPANRKYWKMEKVEEKISKIKESSFHPLLTVKEAAILVLHEMYVQISWHIF